MNIGLIVRRSCLFLDAPSSEQKSHYVYSSWSDKHGTNSEAIVLCYAENQSDEYQTISEVIMLTLSAPPSEQNQTTLCSNQSHAHRTNSKQSCLCYTAIGLILMLGRQIYGQTRQIDRQTDRDG